MNEIRLESQMCNVNAREIATGFCMHCGIMLCNEHISHDIVRKRNRARGDLLGGYCITVVQKANNLRKELFEQPLNSEAVYDVAFIPLQLLFDILENVKQHKNHGGMLWEWEKPDKIERHAVPNTSIWVEFGPITIKIGG